MIAFNAQQTINDSVITQQPLGPWAPSAQTIQLDPSTMLAPFNSSTSLTPLSSMTATTLKTLAPLPPLYQIMTPNPITSTSQTATTTTQMITMAANPFQIAQISTKSGLNSKNQVFSNKKFKAAQVHSPKIPLQKQNDHTTTFHQMHTDDLTPLKTLVPLPQLHQIMTPNPIASTSQIPPINVQVSRTPPAQIHKRKTSDKNFNGTMQGKLNYLQFIKITFEAFEILKLKIKAFKVVLRKMRGGSSIGMRSNQFQTIHTNKFLNGLKVRMVRMV
jgi:hypothetical protein